MRLGGQTRFQATIDGRGATFKALSLPCALALGMVTYRFFGLTCGSIPTIDSIGANSLIFR